VVPVGDGWTVPPFGGEVCAGRLYGRGSADMKSGHAACAVAMSATARAGMTLSGPVELAALVDEEETGKGIRHYLAAGLHRDFAGCIAAEPTDLQAIGLTDRGLRAAVRMTMDMPGLETPAEHPLVMVSSQAVRDSGGPDQPLGGWTAACDGGFIAREANTYRSWSSGLGRWPTRRTG
jgi:acetylornithine deacetylase/succinyl-diaminopimelate desuccinylase-like protein